MTDKKTPEDKILEELTGCHMFLSGAGGIHIPDSRSEKALRVLKSYRKEVIEEVNRKIREGKKYHKAIAGNPPDTITIKFLEDLLQSLK